MSDQPEQTTQAAEQTGPDKKIVIVSGKEFLIDTAVDNEAIRQHLANNFPDVAGATVVEGTRVVEGVSYKTVEFVKKAGTKGMEGGDLAALLRQVPRDMADDDRPVLSAVEYRWLLALQEGRLTFGDVTSMEQAEIVTASISGSRSDSYSQQHERVVLCQKIDNLPAAAVGSDLPLGW